MQVYIRNPIGKFQRGRPKNARNDRQLKYVCEKVLGGLSWSRVQTLDPPSLSLSLGTSGATPLSPTHERGATDAKDTKKTLPTYIEMFAHKLTKVNAPTSLCHFLLFVRGQSPLRLDPQFPWVKMSRWLAAFLLYDLLIGRVKKPTDRHPTDWVTEQDFFCCLVPR